MTEINWTYPIVSGTSAFGSKAASGRYLECGDLSLLWLLADLSAYLFRGHFQESDVDRSHEPMRSAEPPFGKNLPNANAPCWKPALRFKPRKNLQR